MIKPRSSLQAFILLLIYLTIVFLGVGLVANFMGAVIIYFKAGVWEFGWAGITRQFPGVFAYVIPVGVGMWVLERLKERKARKAQQDKERESRNI